MHNCTCMCTYTQRETHHYIHNCTQISYNVIHLHTHFIIYIYIHTYIHTYICIPLLRRTTLLCLTYNKKHLHTHIRIWTGAGRARAPARDGIRTGGHAAGGGCVAGPASMGPVEAAAPGTGMPPAAAPVSRSGVFLPLGLPLLCLPLCLCARYGCPPFCRPRRPRPAVLPPCLPRTHLTPRHPLPWASPPHAGSSPMYRNRSRSWSAESRTSS